MVLRPTKSPKGTIANYSPSALFVRVNIANMNLPFYWDREVGQHRSKSWRCKHAHNRKPHRVRQIEKRVLVSVSVSRLENASNEPCLVTWRHHLRGKDCPQTLEETEET
jgi:hypothetical protein